VTHDEALSKKLKEELERLVAQDDLSGLGAMEKLFDEAARRRVR